MNNCGRGSFFAGPLLLFTLAHLGHHLLTALPVPLLPMIRSDFALDYTRSGIVVSAFYLSYGLGQLPAGWLADRIGRRIVITIGISGVAVAGILVGLSQAYVLMVLFLIVMGAAGGGYHPAAPPLISALVEPKYRGRALGLHMIGGSISYFLAPLFAAAIATVWGWRGAFIALALPTFLFGFAFCFVLSRPFTTKAFDSKSDIILGEKRFTPGWVHRLVVFIVLCSINSAVFFSVVSFTPLFLVDHFRIPEEIVPVYISLLYSAGIWAGPLGGYFSDRVGRVPVILTICFSSGPVIYLLNLVPRGIGLIALIFTIGMIIYSRLTVAEAYIVEHTSEKNRSTILGIYFFCNMEGGGVLTPVMGHVIDQLGFYLSFTIAGGALILVTSVCSLWLWKSND